MNKIIIIGNVGRDPEMRYTSSGQAITGFSVAVNESYTNSNGEKVKNTIWFRVSAWGKQAEICNQYIKKGSKILAEGKLTADKTTGSPRIWTKGDGEAQTSFELSASYVEFLSPRADADGHAPQADNAPPEDDNPF